MWFVDGLETEIELHRCAPLRTKVTQTLRELARYQQSLKGTQSRPRRYASKASACVHERSARRRSGVSVLANRNACMLPWLVRTEPGCVIANLHK